MKQVGVMTMVSHSDMNSKPGPKYIENVSLEEARAVRDNYDRLKMQALEGSEDHCILEHASSSAKINLFDDAKLVYSKLEEQLGLQLENKKKIFGFNSSYGWRIDNLYHTIEKFLKDYSNPPKEDGFTQNF